MFQKNDKDASVSYQRCTCLPHPKCRVSTRLHIHIHTYLYIGYFLVVFRVSSARDYGVARAPSAVVCEDRTSVRHSAATGAQSDTWICACDAGSAIVSSTGKQLVASTREIEKRKKGRRKEEEEIMFMRVTDHFD